ncbi:MAG TPA: YegS/Rv2252/BmrU family lipid kinase [Epulopiscium sp.]|nr:YegS/Rv2252/BmrU family lipid kinase [Candidatus Epulonipiscium sp.]
MKKVKFLYNPNAGNRRIQGSLDIVIRKFQQAGFIMSIYRSMSKGDMATYIDKYVTNDNTDLLVISGGDGSVNEVINAMIQQELKIPLGLLPLGTANDFSTLIGMPQDIEAACDAILNMDIKPIDVGIVNGSYFVNVCSAGLFTSVSHKIDINLKNRFGKMAYYVKGVEQLQEYQPMHLEFETPSGKFEEKVSLFLIFNGKSAGGFDKLGKYALIDDGLLDLVIIKAVAVHEILPLFIKVLQGEHLNDPNVIYMQVDDVTITCLNDTCAISDIDGEQGPEFPLHVSVVRHKLSVCTNLNK